MSREEELARRLCAYAKLEVEVVFNGVKLFLLEDRTSYLVYDSWRQILFGDNHRFSLFKLRHDVWLPEWRSHLDMLATFNFSSLDEFELQLSAMGF